MRAPNEHTNDRPARGDEAGVRVGSGSVRGEYASRLQVHSIATKGLPPTRGPVTPDWVTAGGAGSRTLP